MACREIEVMLTGCIGVFKGITTSQTLTAITTQSNTLKGGSRNVGTSAHQSEHARVP